MVIIPIKEEFERLLLSVSAIVTQLEEHRYTFIDEVRAFVGTVENRAEKYRLPFAAEVGMLRGKLCVIDELGDFPQPVTGMQGGYGSANRKIHRRNREAFALKRLDETCQLVRSFFAPAEALFAEAVNLCRQTAAVAQVKKLIPQLTMEERETQLMLVWESLKSDADLCSLCTHITGLTGIYNAVILFDRALSEIGL